jgi:pseudouridine-5'-phosphate glycosidase
MKRNNAHILIEKTLLAHGLPYHESVQCAALVLIKLEKAGMLPPLNEKLYDAMDNGDRKLVRLAKTVYKWEEPGESEF